jgi:hypothetical protein
MKMQDLIWEAYEPSEKANLFHQTADAQRGPPEATMLKLQNLLGGGVFSFVIEHVGDITNRMAQKFDWAKGQHGLVQDKVEKTLRTLESGYGFEKEMQENFESNFRFNTEQGRMPYDTYEEFVGAARGLSMLYAREHNQIPVFNPPQWHARQAAIELGYWHFSKAITHLKWLKDLCDDEERYDHEVAQVAVQEGTSNGVFLTKSLGAGPTIYPLPSSAKEFENIDSKRRGGTRVKVRKRGATDINIKEWEDENGSYFSDDTLMKSGWFNPTTGENLDSVSPTNYDHRSVWLKHKGQDVPVHQFDNIYNQGFVRYYVVGDNEMGHVVLSGNEKDIHSAGFNKFISAFPLHANYELTVNDKALGKLNET